MPHAHPHPRHGSPQARTLVATLGADRRTGRGCDRSRCARGVCPQLPVQRKSVLTGEPVPLEQAYEDLDTKRELDQAASERDAAKAAAAEIKDKAEAQAAARKPPRRPSAEPPRNGVSLPASRRRPRQMQN